MVQSRRRSVRRDVHSQHSALLTGLLFVAPWLVGFFAFTLYPMSASLYYSFTVYDIVRPPVWIGFDNYTALFQDRLFHIALANTIVYVPLAVSSSVIVAYGLAVLLSQPLRGRALLRTAFYVPTVVPAMSSALLWLWILDTQAGLVNGTLASFGIAGPPWLSHPDWAKPSLVLINLWFIGNALVIFLAALNDVPRSLYDAARVDGANAWQQIWQIALPLTTPAIFFITITGVIGASQVFTFPYILTEGGPADATLMYALYLFRVAFVYLRMGYASALAWVSFVALLAITALLFGSTRRWVFYHNP